MNPEEVEEVNEDILMRCIVCGTEWVITELPHPRGTAPPSYEVCEDGQLATNLCGGAYYETASSAAFAILNYYSIN